jgi:TPR repeat protein
MNDSASPDFRKEWVSRQISRLALEGVPAAQYALGAYYEARLPLRPRHFSKALYWYGRAVQQGYAKARLALYRLGAQRGISHAQLRLAEIYEQGDLVHRDLDRAARLYHKAARQGCGHALRALLKLAEQGQPLAAKLSHYRSDRTGARDDSALCEDSQCTMPVEEPAVADAVQDYTLLTHFSNPLSARKVQERLTRNFGPAAGVRIEESQGTWFLYVPTRFEHELAIFLYSMKD